MGTRLEYVAAEWASVALVVESELDGVEAPRHKPVLVVAGDEATVFEGSRRELRRMIAKMTEALDTWDDVALAADILARQDALEFDEEEL